MRKNGRWVVVLLIMAGLTTACLQTSQSATDDEVPAAVVEQGEGTGLARVILSEEAVARLGVQTAPVREEEVARRGSAVAQLRKIIPYSAVLYDVDGAAFVYTSPEPLTFVRAAITVDYIEGDQAVLLDGPPSGTAVVTVGSAELFGTEFVFEE